MDYSKALEKVPNDRLIQKIKMQVINSFNRHVDMHGMQVYGSCAGR